MQPTHVSCVAAAGATALDARGCWQHPFIACMTCHTLCYVFDRDFVYQIKRKLNTPMQARATSMQFACNVRFSSLIEVFDSVQRNGAHAWARVHRMRNSVGRPRAGDLKAHTPTRAPLASTVTTRARQLRPGNLDDIRPLQIIDH